MEIPFQINNEDQKAMNDAIISIENFPRIFAKWTRNKDGFLLTIEGPDNEVPLFIEKLEESGFTLNK